MSNKIIHRVSRLFQPKNLIQKNPTSKHPTHKGYNLMVDTGIIKNVNTGMYALLPLGLNALQKLINLIDNEMLKIGAQKIQLPVLTSAKLWQKTERLDEAGEELFKLKDRYNKLYIMSPTYEEMITNLVADINVKKSNLPLLLYQISNKWRDELHPRLGLLRAREFVMKDLYSFDANLKCAQQTYDMMCEVYDNIFKQIGINFIKAKGDSSLMGGNISHEYHYLSQTGEDKIHLCSNCNYAVNKIISTSKCPQCKTSFSEHDGIEVGHTFLLNTKYSSVFNAKYKSKDEYVPFVMGCYGLGLTRILAATIEILSTPECIRWPINIVPYNVCIIGPKQGSKEEHVSCYVADIYDMLTDLNIDIIIDDRTDLTIGKRVKEANQTGYPFVIIVGRLATETRPLFEIHDLYNSKCENLSIDAISDYFNKKYTDYSIKRSVSC